MTEEEKEEFANKIIERVYLGIPELIGNLMAQHALQHKINTKFYQDYPEFKDKKQIVASVVEMMEGRNPLKPYDEILKDSVPEIRKRIEIVGKLDTASINPGANRAFSNGEL